jgi:hypothetical protein
MNSIIVAEEPREWISITCIAGSFGQKMAFRMTFADNNLLLSLPVLRDHDGQYPNSSKHPAETENQIAAIVPSNVSAPVSTCRER